MIAELKSLHEGIGAELESEAIDWDAVLAKSRTFYNLVADTTVTLRNRAVIATPSLDDPRIQN